MKKFRIQFAEIQARPEMYFQAPTYDAACALVLGYDLALDGGVLVGFREWLIVRLNFGNNLAWPVLALHAAFPQSTDPREMLESDIEKQKQAITVLFQLISEFDDLRQAPDGLRRIYCEYERWLLKQPWYQPGSPGWIGPP